METQITEVYEYCSPCIYKIALAIVDGVYYMKYIGKRNLLGKIKGRWKKRSDEYTLAISHKGQLLEFEEVLKGQEDALAPMFSGKDITIGTWKYTPVIEKKLFFGLDQQNHIQFDIMGYKYEGFVYNEKEVIDEICSILSSTYEGLVERNGIENTGYSTGRVGGEMMRTRTEIHHKAGGFTFKIDSHDYNDPERISVYVTAVGAQRFDMYCIPTVETADSIIPEERMTEERMTEDGEVFIYGME